MKILVTTIVSLNPGDAAILLGTLRVLRRAFGDDTEVVAVDKDAEVATRLYPWMRFLPSLFHRKDRIWLARWIEELGYRHRLLRWDALRFRWAAKFTRRGLAPLAILLTSATERRVIREYLEADLVVASGGTYLVPNYDLEAALLDYEFVLRIGQQLGVMPQSMGPFISTHFAERVRVVLTRARFVLLRDERSRTHVQELDVPMATTFVVPDAAFALSDPGGRVACAGDRAGRPPRVAISVRYWPHTGSESIAPKGAHGRYLGAIGGLVEHLIVAEHAEVAFVSSCQGIPEYWVDDSKTAMEVVARLPAHVRERVSVDSSFRDPEALLAELRKYDLVVATRMHVAILAICGGAAVLPIAYEFKTRELFGRLGLEQLVVDLHTVDAQALVYRADLLLRDQGGLAERLRVGRNRLVAELDGCADVLRESLGLPTFGLDPVSPDRSGERG